MPLFVLFFILPRLIALSILHFVKPGPLRDLLLSLPHERAMRWRLLLASIRLRTRTDRHTHTRSD